MTLKVISAEAVLFEGEVKAVHLPGAKGQFTVLRNHASLISTLVPGNIGYEVNDDEETRTIPTAGGIVDVDNNVVSVCIY
jgi:ATP synthase F1, epsilon subunit